MKGAPPRHRPRGGDLAYYSPGGNLAIYYEHFGYSSGLVTLGRIDSDLEALSRPGPLRATIELVEK
jgi:hypothetical protein